MNDRPTAIELLDAVREWLQNEALPVLKKQGALGFQGLIAAHVLAIVQRELHLEEDQLRDECDWLSNRLLLTTPSESRNSVMREIVRRAQCELCEQIQHGDFDQPVACAGLIQELRASVTRKLHVNNPRMLRHEDS